MSSPTVVREEVWDGEKKLTHGLNKKLKDSYDSVQAKPTEVELFCRAGGLRGKSVEQ